MSIVTITLAGRSFKLSCSEETRSRLVLLSEKLDLELDKMKTSNPSASFDLALVITALSLMDDKLSKDERTCGETLEIANQDYQKHLSSIFEELKIVAEKVEKC